MRFCIRAFQRSDTLADPATLTIGAEEETRSRGRDIEQTEHTMQSTIVRTTSDEVGNPNVGC